MGWFTEETGIQSWQDAEVNAARLMHLGLKRPRLQELLRTHLRLRASLLVTVLLVGLLPVLAAEPASATTITEGVRWGV